jgi:hypothetical protein
VGEEGRSPSLQVQAARKKGETGVSERVAKDGVSCGETDPHDAGRSGVLVAAMVWLLLTRREIVTCLLGAAALGIFAALAGAAV